jgi:GntR family transcriptional regulator
MSYFGSIYAEDIPHRAKTVYMYLKDRSNAKGECWPGIKTIARELNLSRSTVKRAIADLTAHGYLKKEPQFRENGSSSSNLYSIDKLRL